MERYNNKNRKNKQIKGGTTPDYLRVALKKVACRSAQVSRGVVLNPFPPQLRTTLTFAQSTTESISASGFFKVRSFRINGPYDPDLTGVGGQPKYYDTLLGADGTKIPYSSYCVLNAKISVRVLALQEDVASLAEVVIYAHDDSRNQITASEVFREMPNAIVRTVGIPSSTRGLVEFAMDVDVASLSGIRDLLDSSDMRSLYSTIPSRRFDWDLAVKMYQTSASTVSYSYDVRIDYDMVCLGLNTAVSDTALRVQDTKSPPGPVDSSGSAGVVPCHCR
jgi:hypothetical protein